VEIPAIAEEDMRRNSKKFWNKCGCLDLRNDYLCKCCKLRLLHNQFEFNDALILPIVTKELLALLFQIRAFPSSDVAPEDQLS
jgi:hypothetical protein